MAKFDKGNPGKPKGAVNKVTKTVKEAVSIVFNKLQSEPDGKSDLESWARQRPSDFYQVAAKLIPTEVSATVTEKTIRVERE